MSSLVIIPARKGSKSIKNKNKVLVNGKKLIEYTFDSVKNLKLDSEICLSTDDKEIINIGKKYNIFAPFIRPKYISTDSATLNAVIIHALSWYKKNKNFTPSYVILLQPTSPGREKKDIIESIKLFKKKNKDSLISVSEPINHPCEIIIKKNHINYFALERSNNSQRQKYPKAYFIDGSIYIFKTNFFLKSKKIYDEKSVLYLSKSKNLVDIDDMKDLKYFEFLSKQK
tara:strand:+ start:770 stop:1453 length:684 start_codon:yes stop_codon:yes gene_type:complete